jgi:hypothetical protein
MSVLKDLTGQEFCRLTAEWVAGRVGRVIMWLCACSCGRLVVVRGNDLKNGAIRSCGCLKKDLLRSLKTTHGMSESSEYSSYNAARNRCTNVDSEAYSDYGGRGIKFLFDSFEEFYAVLGPKPTLQHSVDRIDVNGHYEKGNVRWATDSQQMKNRRKVLPGQCVRGPMLDLPIEELQTAYFNEGLSLRQISLAHKCSTNAIKDHLNRAGFTLRRHGWNLRTDSNKSEKAA